MLYLLLAEALNRDRGKGQQKVTVEHVHVHAGGRRSSGGMGSPRGRDRLKSEDQPHAQQIIHAPHQELRSACELQRESLPVANDEKRPMPDARREVIASATGQ
jgi:hypothetical protein